MNTRGFCYTTVCSLTVTVCLWQKATLCKNKQSKHKAIDSKNKKLFAIFLTEDTGFLIQIHIQKQNKTKKRQFSVWTFSMFVTFINKYQQHTHQIWKTDLWEVLKIWTTTVNIYIYAWIYINTVCHYWDIKYAVLLSRAQTEFLPTAEKIHRDRNPWCPAKHCHLHFNTP